MRQTLTGFVGLAMMVAAVAAPAAGHAAAAEAVIKDTTDQVIGKLRSEGDSLLDDPAKLYSLIDEFILPRFDFQQMSKWVLGRYWRQASAEQRDEFVVQFQRLLVQTYGQALVNYRDQKVVFLPSRERSASEVTVRAEIDQGAGPRIPIVYEMHKVGEDWLVYDVAVEGVSLVINYRSSFGQAIKRGGIDGLIRRLAEKNSGSKG